MTHRYIGTKEVVAWPADKDGKPGYGVKYADGYTSWSPKAAFEDAYLTSEPGMHQMLGFGEALYYLRMGKRVSRAGWNGKGLWVEAQFVGEHSKMNRPYLYLNYPENGEANSGARVPWTPSQTDIMDNDWQVLA